MDRNAASLYLTTRKGQCAEVLRTFFKPQAERLNLAVGDETQVKRAGGNVAMEGMANPCERNCGVIDVAPVPAGPSASLLRAEEGVGIEDGHDCRFGLTKSFGWWGELGFRISCVRGACRRGLTSVDELTGAEQLLHCSVRGESCRHARIVNCTNLSRVWRGWDVLGFRNWVTTEKFCDWAAKP